MVETISNRPESVAVRSGFRRRLVMLALAGVCLVAAALFYLNFWYYRPIGIGPVGIAVDRAPYAAPWSQQRVLLLGLGDSITAGFGANPGMSSFQRVAKNSANEFAGLEGVSLQDVLPNLEVQNKAISGTTSIELLEFSLPRLEVQEEDVFGIVLLTTGGNDVIHNYGRTPPREGAMYGATMEESREWISNFENRLKVILDQISEKFPGGCEIFLANIYDPTDGVGDAEHAGLPAWSDGLKVIAAYNAVIERACQSEPNVHLIDIHSAFLGHGIHCRKFWMRTYDSSDPHYWYFDNLEDPNDRGYDAIRRLCLNSIAQFVPPRIATGPVTKSLGL